MKTLNVLKEKGGVTLLKNYFHHHVLLYAVFQLLLTGKSRKGLEFLRQGVYLKVHQREQKNIAKKLEGVSKSLPSREGTTFIKTKKYVWVCWLQGIESAPDLVKKCFQSLQENLKDREIILITTENLREYTDMPLWIMKKYEQGLITHTHFSDLLRIELLCRYGGTWIDATVFCSGGNIPSYMLDSDLFMFQVLKPGSDGRYTSISSWFITSSPNNRILLTVRELLWDYWKKHDKLYDYFLLHSYISIVADYYKEDWKKMIQYPNSMPHILLLMLFEEFNQEKWDAVTSVCPFHKLTYKNSTEEATRPNTYYQYIMNK